MKKEIKLKNNLSELDILTDFVDNIASEWGMQAKTTFEINLALEEIFVNIVSYGYQDKNLHEITVIFENNDSQKLLTIVIIDDGVAFNPLKKAPVDINQPIEERQIGGLGIQFVNNLMQSVKYERSSNQNILAMTKSF